MHSDNPNNNNAKTCHNSLWSPKNELKVSRPFEWLTSASSLASILSKSTIFDDDDDSNTNTTNNNDCDNDPPPIRDDDDDDDDEHNRISLSRKALHVGCGTSALGEYLLQDLHYQEVVNVDMDQDVLDQLKTRWDNHNKTTLLLSSSSSSNNDDSGVIPSRSPLSPQRRRRTCQENATMEFVQVDLSSERIPYASGYFDLVVDKSTLDCTLCSDEASAGLLCEVYRSLKPAEHPHGAAADGNDGNGKRGGAYVVISFHHKDLLFPMLQNLPGAEWTVQHQVMARQVEDLISNNNNNNDTTTHATDNAAAVPVELPACSADVSLPNNCSTTTGTTTDTSSWSNHGEFEPNEHYRKFVNVFICQKKYTPCTTTTTTTTNQRMTTAAEDDELDRDAVREHIHTTNNVWFQSQHPMLTPRRMEELRLEFETTTTTSSTTTTTTSPYVDLSQGYHILFTDAEREHLTFDYFLEDWQAFVQDFPHMAQDDDKMTFETACKFLQVMQ